MSTQGQRFSKEAEQIIYFAKLDAQNLRHYYLGVEHLFLSLYNSPDYLVSGFIKRFNIQYEFTKKIKAQLHPPIENPAWDKNNLLITPRLDKIMKLAGTIAKNYNSDIIFPIHLLHKGGEERA